MKDDVISRQAAIDALDTLCKEHKYKVPGKRETYCQYNEAWQDALDRAEGAIGNLPSAQSEIIRCKDCRWWDKYGDYDNGYCMAAKHGYWSEHWDISIRRTYKGDFYCADAERRTDEQTD